MEQKQFLMMLALSCVCNVWLLLCSLTVFAKASRIPGIKILPPLMSLLYKLVPPSIRAAAVPATRLASERASKSVDKFCPSLFAIVTSCLHLLSSFESASALVALLASTVSLWVLDMLGVVVMLAIFPLVSSGIFKKD